MTAKKIWLATLLVAMILLMPAISKAETFQVSRTDELIALMRQVVQQQYQIEAYDVLIVWNDQDLEAKLAKMGKGLRAELSDQDLKNLVQRDSLMLKVMEGTRYKGSVPVRVKADGWIEVFHSARALQKGEVLKADSVMTQRVKISALPPQAVRAPFRIEDFLVRQDIPAKTVLRSALLQERMLVERGDDVKVLVVQGDLTLVASGEALESGIRNALVRVKIKNFDTNKMIRARVSGEGEVTLEIEA